MTTQPTTEKKPTPHKALQDPYVQKKLAENEVVNTDFHTPITARAEYAPLHLWNCN